VPSRERSGAGKVKAYPGLLSATRGRTRTSATEDSRRTENREGETRSKPRRNTSPVEIRTEPLLPSLNFGTPVGDSNKPYHEATGKNKNLRSYLKCKKTVKKESQGPRRTGKEVSPDLWGGVPQQDFFVIGKERPWWICHVPSKRTPPARVMF